MASLAEIIRTEPTAIYPNRDAFEVIDFKRIEKYQVIGFRMTGLRGEQVSVELGRRGFGGVMLTAAHFPDPRNVFFDFDEAKNALLKHLREGVSIVEGLQHIA